ncbi:uncharacterized protein LOC132758877 [Ruditapes philippinarum]|uniref:uncharacterized protein LOC132758877 n=1 Tax=Ruditapes philippinarum TaxID=129788 RepID=UPI00295BF7F1|nr:uncharacterized protein LOC132758877 [Ruditapes philippinarum]
MSALVPESGVLCYSNNTVGANFLSTSGSIKNSCCLKRKVSEVAFHRTGLTSLGSVDSFKSLSSSFQSFYDEDTMYSANSSMVETSASAYGFERQISEMSSARDSYDTGPEDLMFPNDCSFDPNNYLDPSAADWNSSLLDTLKAGEPYNSTDVESKVEKPTKYDSAPSINKCKDDLSKHRSDSTISDFYNIDIDKDLKCNVKGCACDKTNRKSAEDKSKCNTEQTGAKDIDSDSPNEHNDNNQGKCNDELNVDKTSVFNIDRPTDLALNTEYIHGDNEDITPVMTDSTSTLCDQIPVIQKCDSASIKTVETDNHTVDVESGPKVTKDGSDEIKSISSEQNTKLENDTKGCVIQHKAAQSEISSDSGLDIDNILEKQTSLDFGSVSDKSSDIEFGEKTEELLGDGFSLDHDKHGYTLCQDNVPRRTSVCENISAMEAKKRKWKFMHPFKNLHDGENSVGHSLQKVLVNYNNIQHIVFSLLSGRPVVVMGTRRQEVTIREFIQAMSMFVPYTPRSSSVSLLCQIKQLKLSDMHKFQLRGVIRSDKRSIDYLIPKSVRRFMTFIDLEKNVVYCQPYQGILLNFITSIHNKKKTFKSEAAILTFTQLCLQEISNKAFSFYHTVTSSNEQIDFIGASLPHKNSMLELTLEKYLNRAGVHNSDCRIVKYLTEIVKLQQIEEEFRSKYLTDAPAYPFSVTHQPMQTYRL